jgi:hypothetical protein
MVQNRTQVLPSDYGTQRPFYFPLLPSFWSGCLPSATRPRFSSMDSEEMLQTALLPDADVSESCHIFQA